MAMIEIPNEIYERLARRAADEHTSVEDIIAPLLDRFASEGAGTRSDAPSSLEDRIRAFDEWMNIVGDRAERYPAGYIVDDSRESIYARRGE
jgi:hypothetical protein